MRLIALLIPVGLVSGFLAVQASRIHEHQRVVVVPEAPVVTHVVTHEAPRVTALASDVQYAVAVSQNTAPRPTTVTIDFSEGIESTITASIEAALHAAVAGIESADLSLDATEGILAEISEVLGELSINIDGELELVTSDGDRLRISADGSGGIVVSKISNE